MDLRVIRFSPGEETTLGLLLIDGEFVCFTLEDEMREIKVPFETAIPNGSYVLKLRTWGDFHERYSRPDSWAYDIHEGMIEVMNVTGFTNILIHTGNKGKHTAGCLLLGDSVMQNLTEDGNLISSRTAYRRVYPLVRDALKRGDRCTITYETDWLGRPKFE